MYQFIMKNRYLNLVVNTYQGWSRDNAPRLAAALAFYTAFSIAPLLVLVIAIAGFILGHQAAQGHLVNEIGDLVGANAAQLIQEIIKNASKQGNNIVATIIGAVTLLVGATGVFAELQNDFDIIWHVKPKPEKGLWSFIRSRVLSFGMILVLGFLLLVSLVISAFLSSLGVYVIHLTTKAQILLQIINVLISIVVIAFLFAMIFKFLPDVSIKWRDVWIGSVVTAILFSIGKVLIGLYLGKSTIASSYGAAGSLAILLLWVYYSAQILFFGAEFTRAEVNMRGARIEPAKHAEKTKGD